jgi:chemotaxis regulatin CheY-phosphate phosphatase CheZ
MEFTGKIKEIARELIEFRKDIQKRIEPDIIEIAAKDIPEASYQLEGINENLEKSTMKIMDINEEQMELSNSQYDQLRFLVSGNGQGVEAGTFWEEGRDLTLKIRALLGAMPQEAKEAADFILPNLNLAIEHMSQKDDLEQIIEALEEPIGIIKDLVRDCGNSHEPFARLEELNTRLAEMVGRVQENGNILSGQDLAPDKSLEALRHQMNVLKKISDLSLSMMEPLSFQDLVGQRIQRIIKLVKTMEMRIEDLIISFGIKFRRHREDPGKSYEDLKKDVEKYRAELKGPQREGQGLSQRAIDDLLATL